ncbi:MAG: hypothetical protein ACJ754_08540 [Pyrinomonadaceae bacterium]
MRTKRTMMVLALATTVALVALGTYRGTRRVRAQSDTSPPVSERVSFGMVGITRGETARLSVVNTSDAICPCQRITLNFRDADGRLLRNRDGRPVRKEVTLEPGQSAFLDLDADDLQFPPGPTRLQFRAVVTMIPPPVPESGGTPPPIGDRSVPSVEVFNNSNGRTVLFIGNPGVIRGFNPQPDPPLGN